jgi:hypothetical protein
MERFWLRVHGDDLWRAWAVLNGANIPTIAITEGYRSGQPPPDLKLLGLTAAVDAETEERAKSRVLGVLPEGYETELRDPAEEL